MSKWYEKWFGRFFILGIALLIGGLIFLFVIYPMFFSNLVILYWIDIIGIIGAVALIIIGIIGAIAD